VRDIHPRIAAIPGIGGAAVLGDGRVVLIIDGGDLFQLAQTREPVPAGPAGPVLSERVLSGSGS